VSCQLLLLPPLLLLFLHLTNCHLYSIDSTILCIFLPIQHRLNNTVHFSTPKGGKVPVRSYTKPFYYIKKCIDQGPPAINNCLLPLASPTNGREVIGAGGDSTEPFIQQMKMELKQQLKSDIMVGVSLLSSRLCVFIAC